MKSKHLSTYGHLRYGNVSDEENVDKDICLLFELTDATDFKPDTEKAWNTVRSQVKPATYVYWLRIAAMIVVIFGIGIISYTSFFQNSEMIIVASGNLTKDVILPDGSSVLLNANSTLEYPEEFGAKRSVNLAGEGYFDVEKGRKSFRIHVGNSQVTVLGTQFNVKETNDEISVLVTSGTVRFGNAERSIDLVSGQEGKIIIDRNTLQLNHTPDLNKIAWVTGEFDFKNTRLSEVISTLESHFETSISLSNTSIGKCEVTGSFDTKDLKTILQDICTVLDLKLEYRKKQYTLKGKGC